MSVPGGGSGNLIFFIAIGLVVAAEVALAVLLLPSRLSALGTLSGQVESSRKEVVELEGEVSALQGIDQREVEKELLLATSALPSEKRVSGLVSGLTNLASSSGTLLLDLNLSPGQLASRAGAVVNTGPTEASGAEESFPNGVFGIPMTMTLSGSEDQLEGLMTKLQMVSPLVGIKSVDYSVGSAGSAAGFNLLIFFQPVGQVAVNKEAIVPISGAERQTMVKLSNRTLIVQ